MSLSLTGSETKNIQGLYQLLLKKNIQKIRAYKNPVSYLGLILLIFLTFALFPKPPSVKEGFLFPAANALEKNQHFFDQTDSIVFESFQPIVLGENSFKEATPIIIVKGQSLGSLTFESNERKEITEYIVESGDTLLGIAQKFDISLETILWANDLSKNSKISPREKLTILPVSGVMHLVGEGETVSGLAKKYKVDASEIIAVNDISDEGKIFRGDILVIPGGKPLPKPSIYYAPLASSYFICPISSPCRITQRLHWYNAIDFSNGRCAEPVFSAAGGEIQKTGYHSVAGKYVRILHPNGVVTFYGHLSTILAIPGQRVSQGEIIGYTGNTGFTIGATGCHLHFEVRGARNPFAY